MVLKNLLLGLHQNIGVIRLKISGAPWATKDYDTVHVLNTVREFYWTRFFQYFPKISEPMQIFIIAMAKTPKKRNRRELRVDIATADPAKLSF